MSYPGSPSYGQQSPSQQYPAYSPASGMPQPQYLDQRYPVQFPSPGGSQNNQNTQYNQNAQYNQYHQSPQQYAQPSMQQTAYVPLTANVPAPPRSQPIHTSNQGVPQLSGRKKALLIGINYPGSSAPLRGCIQDVQNVKRFLIERYGFSDNPQSMVVLTDEDKNRSNQWALPNRKSMTAAMQWLVSGAAPGDSLFMHYSGHGSQQRDTDGDEEDGFDETICPTDYATNGMITDDEMHEIMVKPLPAGCRLTVLFDSCHSGTALDLPYVYLPSGQMKRRKTKLERVAQTAAEAGKQFATGNQTGAMQSLMGIVNLGGATGQSNQSGSSGGGTLGMLGKLGNMGKGGKLGMGLALASAASSLTGSKHNSAGRSSGGGSSGGTNYGAGNIFSSKEDEERLLQAKTCVADVVMFSGCKDVQTSADAHIEGQHTGAMSWSLLTAIGKNSAQSYAQILASTRDLLKGKYNQIPQLSTGRPVDVNQLFVL